MARPWIGHVTTMGDLQDGVQDDGATETFLLGGSQRVDPAVILKFKSIICLTLWIY